MGRNPFVDRRREDPSIKLAITVVKFVGGIGVTLAVGSIGLSACRLPVPEWIGNATIAVISGLTGFLANNLLQRIQHAPSVTTENVENVNLPSEGSTQEGEHGADTVETAGK